MMFVVPGAAGLEEPQPKNSCTKGGFNKGPSSGRGFHRIAVMCAGCVRANVEWCEPLRFDALRCDHTDTSRAARLRFTAGWADADDLRGASQEREHDLSRYPVRRSPRTGFDARPGLPGRFFFLRLRSAENPAARIRTIPCGESCRRAEPRARAHRALSR